MAIDFTKSYPVIEWDLNNYHFFTKYFGKKEENSRGFKVQILQDGEVLTPTTETLRIYCKKKDGTSVYIDSSSIVDSYYIINLTNQVFAIEGLVECELQLNSGGIWRHSPTFGINVDDSLVDGSIVSSNDFIALQDALNRVDNLEDTYASRLTAVETDKVDKSNIVNNTVTTVEGTVLDGRMGKNLQDQVTTINNKLANIVFIKPNISSSRVTDLVNGYYRVGGFVYVSLSCKAGVSITDNMAILSAFPSPTVPVVITLINTTKRTITYCIINQTGFLNVRLNPNTSGIAEVGDEITITGCYTV